MTPRGGTSFDARNAEERERVAGELLANRGGRQRGDEIHFECPNEAAGHRQGGAADYNIKLGVWKCQGCGAKGHAGDLARLLGLAVPSSRPAAPAGGVTHARAVKKPEKPARVLTDAELVEADCYCGKKHKRPRALHGFGEPSRWWFYHDADGAARWAVLRFETKDADGEPDKTFRQFDLTSRTWAGPPEPRPLYRLDVLEAQPGAPVVLVEGEKCADALAGVDVLATSAMCGANSVGKADLRPLAGRAVYLWRDNYGPGEGWLAALLEALPAAGVLDVFVVPIPADKPEKWDAADAIAEGMDADAIAALIGQGEPAPKPPRRLNAIELGDFLTLDIPERELLLEPWLPAQGLAMVYSKRGVGKTQFALGVAYAIATGGEFMRFRAPKASRVLYIDGEMPARTMQERLRAIARAAGGGPPALGFFKLVTPDQQDRPIPDLATLEGRAAIDELAADGFDVVVIDNISTLCRTGEENQAEGWLPVQELALDLRRRGMSVLFVHHAGKSGQQRGTSKREDVLDSVITLKHPANYSPAAGACFEVHFEKSRGFHGKAAEPFEATLEFDERGAAVWALRSIDDAKFGQVVELIRDGMSAPEAAKAAEVDRATAYRYRKRAIAEGLIEAPKKQRKGGADDGGE